MKTRRSMLERTAWRSGVVGVATASILLAVVSSCTRDRIHPHPTADGQLEERTAADLSQRLQALLDDLVEGQGNVRGGLLLVEGPGFRWKGASGVAFQAAGTPMLPDDQFAIDSIAKTMTATIVMGLVEDGRLTLDDRIDRHLPPALMNGLHVIDGRSYSDRITVRDLLRHSSGVHDDWSCADFLDRVAGDLERRWTPVETIDFVKTNCEPLFLPGAGFHYSDTGYNLLGLIIERVTGQTLHAAYRQRLLDPLRMDHTYRPAFEAARPSIPGRLPSERFFGDVECSLSPAVMTADWGGGGIISNTDDLNRFLRAFVANQIFRQEETRTQMMEWVDSGPFHRYGFGIGLVDFDRSDDPSHAGFGPVWGHAGSSQNFMYYWPGGDVTVVGTLNQIDSEFSLYDTVATILAAVRDTLAE